VLLLTEADVRRLLDLPALITALEGAFVELSAGRASVPPRVAARTSNGLLGAMPGFLPGVALEAKLVTVFPANHDQGRPSHQGVIVLFDERDGAPLALMDAVHITAIRTAAAAALSTSLLAREDVQVLAVLGAGAQGASHLEAVPLARSFREIRVASRTVAHAGALARRHPGVLEAASFEDAVRGADVVCCCTDARQPILRRAWLAPGTHVTAVGGTFGPELDPETIAAASMFVESRDAATSPPPAGAHELQGIDPSSLTELGEVISRAKPGRVDPNELTIYKSMGHAVEDAAAARLVYDRALAEGAGLTFEL
jgi:ornithine cyclodeaminase/alanine dehydrogenase-like protein (mu-crystallin family)